MQAKIINDTSLTIKDMMVANFLNNRFICITYTILFVIFGGSALFVYISGANFTFGQTLMTILLLAICLFAGTLYPVFASIYWYFKYKRKYKVTNQELEYEFFDIYMKVHNKTLNMDTKVDYRHIRKKIETKKYLLLTLKYSSFILINKNGFKKENDLDKLKAYLKRQGI